ncbi:MAG: hemerythrin domain-containing protein [Rhodobacteraceae bacterium]|jgi:iron-sulfur cluster repair protein YtfE (RIC family)|nr:hemerythrin domain-containing protein [Paracoccaceae bacterium]
MNPLDLDARTGLPPHLRILADKYPRADWAGHPNFNQLTAFWLERHGMFRQVMTRVLDLTRGYIDAPRDRYAPELSRYTGFFLNELHGHHNIEDHHYFPQFNALDRRLEQGFELLDKDHHALDAHIHALAEATNRVLIAIREGQGAQDAAGALEKAQSGFQTFLERHLADEEEIIVPLILEYGSDLS